MSLNVKVLSSPFSGYLERALITSDEEEHDILKFVEKCKPEILKILLQRLHLLKGIKFWICVSATYYRTKEDGSIEELPGYFPNLPKTALNSDEMESLISDSCLQISTEIESFEAKGSDWVLRHIDGMDVYTAGYTPLRASCHKALPKVVEKKRAVVNVKNNDDRCFLWSILAALFPKNVHAERVSQYTEHVNELNFENISFPVKVRDIQKFTALNAISVNVFTWTENNRIYPIYRAQERLERHVNLFYYAGHYSWIRSFDRLMGDQNKHKRRGYFCDMCLYPMYSEQKLQSHIEICTHESLAVLEMPPEDDNILKFRNIHRMLRKPLVVYADFEAILCPVPDNNAQNRTTSYTKKYQRHEPCSFGMVTAKSCCGDAEFSDLHVKTVQDPATEFIQRLVVLADNYAASANRYPLNMSDAEEQKFNEETICFVCKKQLDQDRVRDHCHCCGRFRGAAHSHCNQMLRLDKDLVVVMHNLRRYDAHIIMKSLGKAASQHGLKLSCVAKGSENYVTFSMERRTKTIRWKIRFIDSAQFLAASLEKLVSQLSSEQFACMKTYFQDHEIDLLARKGVFPYDFLDSWEKLNATHPIPKKDFYNKLNKTDISEQDYNHYLNVSQMIRAADLQEYLEIYLKLDVTQLADVFENFRKFSLDNYGLDPCHYSTLPGLAWDACLKTTGVELELLTDPDQYAFLEAGIRGGISVISKRRAEANNKHMVVWNSEATQAYIVYFDANNLYGWSMCEMLPTKDFRWLTEQEIEHLEVENIDLSGEDGYILEVDLDYPDHLHDKHNCYPLAPEKLKIEREMLSNYSKQLADEHGLKLSEVEKLAPNLYNKNRYIVHLRNLRFYMKEGLILRKIHRVLTFRQTAWMAEYVKFNTNMRRQATDEFSKALYKFYVNAVFGKTMENVRKYLTVELVTDLARLRKLTKKPNFQRACIFDDNLVACCMHRTVINLNKPIYVGFVVLELSKLLMFDFHYGYIREMYGDCAELCMTDTDSLMYLVQTDRDVYEDMLQNAHLFDTSDYPVQHFLHSNVNKKVVGKMKDELSGQIATSFIGLRSKMYSIKSECEEKKRAKGVKRKVVEDEITHRDYVNTLEKRMCMYHQMCSIRSYKHELFTVEQQKKSLSCYDDKRYILEDGINTLAHGHYKTRTPRD